MNSTALEARTDRAGRNPFREGLRQWGIGVSVAVTAGVIAWTAGTLIAHEQGLQRNRLATEWLAEEFRRCMEQVKRDQTDFRREYREDLTEIKALIKEIRK